METVNTPAASEWFSELGLEDERAYLSHFEHDGIKLVRTCIACPEAYDAFNSSGENVGNFRLRHGLFTVAAGDEIVHNEHVNSDGIFSPEERSHHLRVGVEALNKFLLAR